MTARWPRILGSPSTSRDIAKLNLVLWLKCAELIQTLGNLRERSSNERRLRQVLRCRRSLSSSAECNRPQKPESRWRLSQYLILARQATASRRDPMASACPLPRVWFGFVGHAFERSVVGFVVSLGLLRIGLLRLLLMFVPATTSAATHALRVSADRRQADGECKKHNCRCAGSHVCTRNRAPHDSKIEPN